MQGETEGLPYIVIAVERRPSSLVIQSEQSERGNLNPYKKPSLCKGRGTAVAVEGLLPFLVNPPPDCCREPPLHKGAFLWFEIAAFHFVTLAMTYTL